MLDVDLENSEATLPTGQDAGGAEDAGQRPVSFSEWFQVASAEELRSCLLSLVAERPEAAQQVQGLLVEERAHQDWVQSEEKKWTERQPAPAPGAAKEPRRGRLAGG